MTFDEVHTAITEIDEAFEAGELGMSREERRHLDLIVWTAGEESGWKPSREDVILLEELLARSVPQAVLR
jgi:hypothetical protein